MTYEETKEIIKTAIAEIEWSYPLDYAVAFEKANVAIEKQIPKKIIERTEADREYIDYCCPACKVILEQKLKSVKFPLANRDSTVKTFKYCYGCGQKIDWSDKE